MKFVILETPFAPRDKSLKKEDVEYKKEVEENLTYAKECVNFLLKNHKVAFASHLYFTQDGILDDTIPEERQLGIDAGLHIAKKAEESLVFIDYGISGGMVYGIKSAIENNRKITINSLPYFEKLDKSRMVGLHKSFKRLEEEFSIEQLKEWVVCSSDVLIKKSFKEYEQLRKKDDIMDVIQEKLNNIKNLNLKNSETPKIK